MSTNLAKYMAKLRYFKYQLFFAHFQPSHILGTTFAELKLIAILERIKLM